LCSLAPYYRKRFSGFRQSGFPDFPKEEGEVPTAAADIYAFGAMLHELLTGRLPFHAVTRAEWARVHREESPPNASPARHHWSSKALADVVLRHMAKWVRARPGEAPHNDRALGDGLGEALVDVALRCLAKDPARRPQSFGEAVSVLEEIGKKHDPVTAIMTTIDSYNQREWLAEVRKGLRPRLVRALSELDEHHLALQELDAIPEEEYDAMLWLLRGTHALTLRARRRSAGVL
jgi:serine/threonine protein kinase